MAWCFEFLIEWPVLGLAWIIFVSAFVYHLMQLRKECRTKRVKVCLRVVQLLEQGYDVCLCPECLGRGYNFILFCPVCEGAGCLLRHPDGNVPVYGQEVLEYADVNNNPSDVISPANVAEKLRELAKRQD